MKIGYDSNGDGDIADAGNTLEVSDDFASSGTALGYDNNGNLTSDGVLQYVYDGWNRLKEVQRRGSAAVPMGPAAPRAANSWKCEKGSVAFFLS